MYKLSTPERLRAWRKWRDEIAAAYVKRGEPAPDDMRAGLPPGYFNQDSPATPNREPRDPDGRPRTPTYNYGEGLGPDIADSRPFRFVGYADEVVRSIRHTGWYGDDEGTGFTVMRGVVFQLPARKGKTQYLAGVEWGENGAGGKFHGGGGWMDIGRGDVYEDKEDAARAADSMAERAAEAEKDYQREEQARQDEADKEAAEQAAADEAERAEFADRTGGGD